MSEHQAKHDMPNQCEICGSVEGNCEHYEPEPCPECERYRALLVEIIGCSTLKKAWAVAEGGLK